MTKPDRIVRTVEQAQMGMDIHSGYFKQNDVVKLLRREAAYQRARMRKMVNTLDRYRRGNKIMISTTGYPTEKGDWILYRDLLAALKEGR